MAWLDPSKYLICVEPLRPVVFAERFSNQLVPYRTLNLAFLEHMLIAYSLNLAFLKLVA